jgi:predicted dehydrogenase
MMVAKAAPVRVLMVAIGGYGYYYLEALLGHPHAALAGVVDPEAGRSRAWPVVAQLGVPVCNTVEQFYGAGHAADLTVIASPIHWHVTQSRVALAHGSHVLCDKPLGATVQEADALVDARDRAGRFVMIGYQWSFSTAIQALKRDILAGAFGRPRRFSALCAWPRDLAYYRRNNWAGRLRDPDTGRWVLDSPANNAMAHFLHNLLYLAGPAIDESAAPQEVQAEIYRAYAIESADTTTCRARVGSGADEIELLFFASHVTEAAIEPVFRLEFDEATVTSGEPLRVIVGRGRTGIAKQYGAPDDTPQFQKLSDAIAVAGGASASVVCGPEAARAQTLVVNGMHESVPDVRTFPAALVEEDASSGRRWVRGLDDVLARLYEQAQLPSELGIDWAASGRTIPLQQYCRYPTQA